MAQRDPRTQALIRRTGRERHQGYRRYAPCAPSRFERNRHYIVKVIRCRLRSRRAFLWLRAQGQVSVEGLSLVSRARSLISCSVVFALAVAQAAPTFAAEALTKSEYEACQAREEPAFHAAIEAISIRALKTGIANVDFRAIVGDEWRRGGLDEIVDQRVDLAVEEVRQETSWANLLESLASQQKAQDLATAVAERVYRSDAMKTALETLAIGVVDTDDRGAGGTQVAGEELPLVEKVVLHVSMKIEMVARQVGEHRYRELSAFQPQKL